jgi:hypothetical protein
MEKCVWNGRFELECKPYKTYRCKRRRNTNNAEWERIGVEIVVIFKLCTVLGANVQNKKIQKYSNK